jgi:hypothetical protein
MPAKVVNMHNVTHWGRYGDVCIDRTTPYGNPFYMHKDTPQERNRVIAEFDIWLQTQPNFITPELLAAKRLGCHCHPKPCHGDIILKKIMEMRYNE